jgi:sensor histidine kinase YesM
LTVNEFIFSDKKPHKLIRHLTFWGVFGIQYYLQSLVPISHLFYSALISLFCYFPACILSVYLTLHFLRPVIQERKYFIFIFGLALLTISLLSLNYFASMLLFWLTCDCSISSITFIQFLQLANINTAHAMTTGVMVLGFKVAKDWTVKQRANQRLMNLKAANELQLQKARIYPSLLFQSLNSVYDKMISGSANSPEIILRLSELLSYLLYESTEKLIPVEKELNMIVNLVSIEKINQAQHLNIHYKINSYSDSKFIKPLILFPFLQNCFEIIGTGKGHHMFYLEIVIDNQILHVSMVIEKVGQTSIMTEWSHMLKSMKEKIDEFREEVFKLKLENHEGQCKIVFDLHLANPA